jgi:hypothetical protein
MPAGAARRDPAPSAGRLRAAAWCAYAAGAGGIAGIVALVGFFALEVQSTDQPLGTASDLATAFVGLLIPPALAPGGYLPRGLRTGLLQATGITAMAVTAAAGPLMAAGQLSYDVETPVSVASSLPLTAGSLAGMSPPHQVLLWTGVVIGGTAWCLSPVWDLFLGRELARAATASWARPARPEEDRPTASQDPGQPHRPHARQPTWLSPEENR